MPAWCRSARTSPGRRASNDLRIDYVGANSSVANARLRQLRSTCVPKHQVGNAFCHFASIAVFLPAFFPNAVDLAVVAAQIKGRVDNREKTNREYRDADHPHARLRPKIRRRRLKLSEAQTRRIGANASPPWRKARRVFLSLDQPDHPGPRRLRARITPIRANIVGPLFSAACVTMRSGLHLFAARWNWRRSFRDPHDASVCQGVNRWLREDLNIDQSILAAFQPLNNKQTICRELLGCREKQPLLRWAHEHCRRTPAAALRHEQCEDVQFALALACLSFELLGPNWSPIRIEHWYYRHSKSCSWNVFCGGHPEHFLEVIRDWERMTRWASNKRWLLACPSYSQGGGAPRRPERGEF